MFPRISPVYVGRGNIVLLFKDSLAYSEAIYNLIKIVYYTMTSYIIIINYIKNTFDSLLLFATKVLIN